MHEVGFLMRLIPEFGRVRFLVQHDLYHHYTVDEHTLRALETLDALHNTEDRNRAGFGTVPEIVSSRAAFAPSFGTDRNSPSVYGCFG